MILPECTEGDVHPTKREHVHATAAINTVATTVTTTTNTTTYSIAITCKVKSIKIKLSGSVWIYRLSKGHISNVIAMANCIKLKLLGLD